MQKLPLRRDNPWLNVRTFKAPGTMPVAIENIPLNISGETTICNWPQDVSACVSVSNFPNPTTISGSVLVANWPVYPSTMTVSGPVSVSNFPIYPSYPSSMTVSVSNFPNYPSTMTVSVSNFPSYPNSMTVSNFPTSMTVSVSNFPSYPTSMTVSGPISVSNYPSTMTVSGPISVSNFPTYPSNMTISGPISVSGSVLVRYPTPGSMTLYNNTTVVNGTRSAIANLSNLGHTTVTVFGSTSASAVFAVQFSDDGTSWFTSQYNGAIVGAGSYGFSFPCAAKYISIISSGILTSALATAYLHYS